MEHSLLDTPESHLTAWGIADLERGRRNLLSSRDRLPPPLFGELVAALDGILPRCADPDMALNNIERFLAHPQGAGQMPALVAGDKPILDILCQLFSTSHFFSDLLCLHPEYLDILRRPIRETPGKEQMQAELQADVAGATDDTSVLLAFRRFRGRQMLRIGVNDIIHDRPLEEITRDISNTADVSLEVALALAQENLTRRFGLPFDRHGAAITCVILALGKLGGQELNYSSDIDLMFVYEDEGATRGGTPLGADDYFARVVSEVVRLLSGRTDLGTAYRVDLRLRPEGRHGPLARSLASTLAYYDSLGRTWERQALIKVRPVAGSQELGRQFLEAIEPFVYRQYLTFAEINEIKALKRRIENKSRLEAGGFRPEENRPRDQTLSSSSLQPPASSLSSDVKTGRGGIRDIEFTLQFLQLLNGGDMPDLRQRSTLGALIALERAGCLTDPEYRVLDDSYRFYRKLEHRLQLLFDLQTHRLPASKEEMRKLALRMGYRLRSGEGEFQKDFESRTTLTRRILDHLLHQTFAGDPEEAQPESDLLLVPDPEPETVREVLGRYPFRDIDLAFFNLTQLAQEHVPFLSTRRCRHFLASIAPALLRAVARTPDPDMALTNLEKVSRSIGCKSVLWELFSFNTPSLHLYVDLCASSQFLSEILINNPGMIDELLDSLVLNQPRTREELQAECGELCRGAVELDPIVHSFQDKELLRIGVRDILGKDAIQETAAALSDLAEAILVQVADSQLACAQARFGLPHCAREDGTRVPCRFALLALGKLGAREMNYHSDLDLLLVYEEDGSTLNEKGEATDNFHFFTEWTQRLIKALSTMGAMGRLYEVDMKLRPHGKSANLVVPLAEFRRYYLGDPQADSSRPPAQLWERQALTRARFVYGDAGFARVVHRVIEEGVFEQPWRGELIDEMMYMRGRLEASRTERNLKRGFGGLVDVEFLVQMFQIKYGRQHPQLRTPSTWTALDRLREAGLLSREEHAALRQGYDFLLRVQSRLRIVHNLALDEVPEAPEEVDKLARRLGFETGSAFLTSLERHANQTRELYLRLMARER